MMNKPRIYYSTPYSSEKDLGRAYNDFAALVPDDAWLCLMDADTMPTVPDYGWLIEQVIMNNPHVSAFTATTNRVKCKWQLAPVDWSNDDMCYHRIKGYEFALMHGSKVEDVTSLHVFSGFFLCIKKSLWEKIGGAKEGAILGVDNNLHRRIRQAGERLYCARGLYFYHWYRGGDCNDTSHLK